jgi:hypothetical protein
MCMTTTRTATVETYKMFASNGRYIRQATLVRYNDGTVVEFTEKMTKREALKQAEGQR